MQDFLRFLAAVRGHWEAIALGGVGTLLTWGAAPAIRWLGDLFAAPQLRAVDSVPAGVVWAGAIVGVFWACFLAWQSEHAKANQADAALARLRDSDLLCSIEQVGWAPHPDDGSLMVFLNGTVANQGAPTVVDHFLVEVDIAGQTYPLEQVGFRCAITLHGHPIAPKDYLVEKGIAGPLAAGAKIRGWILASPIDQYAGVVTLEAIKAPGNRLRFSAADIRGRRSGAEHVIHAGGAVGKPLYYPDGGLSR